MILITGATGYVGQNLVSKLSKDQRVRCFVTIEKSVGDNVDFVRGDLSDINSLEEATRGISSVVHLAAVIKSRRREEFVKVNVEGTKNLLSACIKNKVKRFIYISSYDVILRNKNDYAFSKIQAEDIVKNSGLDYIIIRPTVIYGRGDKRNLGMLFGLIKKYSFAPVIGSGNYKLQPVYVEDVVEAIVKCLEIKKAKKTYFVGGPEALTFNEVVNKTSEVLSKRAVKLHIPLPIIKLFLKSYEKVFRNPFMTYNELLSTIEDKTCDISETEKELGFRPISFEEGLKKVFSVALVKTIERQRRRRFTRLFYNGTMEKKIG